MGRVSRDGDRRRARAAGDEAAGCASGQRGRGVAVFSLLLSPDVFDFSQPVKVVANGRMVFEGRVEPSVPTLLEWAARDNDRTMLFGSELHITVPD